MKRLTALLFVLCALTGARARLEPTDFKCPTPDAKLDADGCPAGLWGFPGGVDTTNEKTRAEVCAEIKKLCDAR